ncbi:MAG: outer membrane protein assembly factor BamA [Myxococcaceae bacterium]
MRVQFAVLVLVSLHAIVYAALPSNVEVTGARAVDIEVIVRVTTEALGEPPDASRSASALRKLWALGIFSDVSIELRGERVEIHVKELPTIHGTLVQGECGDLTKKTKLPARGLRAQPVVLARTREALRDACRKDGYALAEVSGEIVRIDDFQVDAVFTLQPQARVRIERVHFPGARAIPARELAAVVATRPHTVVSFLTGDGIFQTEQLEQDAHRLRAFYWDRGHLDVEVSPAVTLFNDDRTGASVRFPIQEGPVYQFGKVSVGGHGAGLSPKLVSQPGVIFRRSDLATDISSLVALFQDRGHPFADVTPLTDVHADTRTVDVRFVVHEGPVATVERIDISGNTRTREEVIRRELRIAEGDRFSSEGVRKSRERILATGFFESVELLSSKGASDSEVVLTVQIREKKSGYFNVGAGVSAAGVFGMLQVSETNLLGRGQSLSFTGQLGLGQTGARGSWVDPHFLRSDLILGVDAFHDTTLWNTFDRHSTGASVSGGYHFTDELSGGVSYTFNALRSEMRGAGFWADAFEQGTTASLRTQMTYDSRDNRLHPRSGMMHQAFVELASPALGGTHSFVRYGGFARFYAPLPLGITLRTQASFGVIQSLSSSSSVPLSERYFLGGLSSVRGYLPFSLTPAHSVATTGSPDSSLKSVGFGGDKQLQLNLELEFPIAPQIGLRGVVFYDAGNVYAPGMSSFSSSPLPMGLYHSVGAGLRWDSPLGPLRLEIGVPLTPRVRDERYRIEFGIGTSF